MVSIPLPGTARITQLTHLSWLFFVFPKWQSLIILAFVSGCQSTQAAAKTLGYTQTSWDNRSKKEKQPAVALKSWKDLTHDQRVAAVTLGYTGKTWDNKSGKEKQPASKKQRWTQLTTCGEYLSCYACSRARSFVSSLSLFSARG